MMVLSTSIGDAQLAEEPTARNSNLLPVKANGLVRLRSVLSISRSEERRVGKECRSRCDWSSDVCSSDLIGDAQLAEEPTARNSNLLPVKANGLVRLRSVLSIS